MIFDLHRQRATPKAHSVCPSCQTPLLAKCGSINIWHWAHVSTRECDPWWEPISAWHLSWQSLVKDNCREVVIGNHRADIQLSTGHVVEIQHSSISPEELAEREAFYQNMTWIIDAESFWHNLLLKEKVSKTTRRPYYSFRWKRPRLSFVKATCLPMYFDNGQGGVLEVRGWTGYENEGEYGPYTSWVGWGHLHEKAFPLFNHLFGLDYQDEPSAPASLFPAS